ncbi:Gametogenetin [Tupaia chinensis]|uniref:Gametogenetin n=1 Tax=Tupaia chinensis TaxID=246437 RepID=L8YC06_TUPCH|nr:Gametogenetin [Tupaia chinensis]
MGNVQSEPSAGGGSRKEQASDRASDSRRTSLAEPEVTPSSPAMRLARGLGVWFPGSSAPPGLLVPPDLQASPSPLPLTLDLASPVTPPSEEAAAVAVSTPPPPPVGTLLPVPSKWRKPTGTPVPRIVLNSCPCKCYCRHQLRHRRLPRNVSAWLNTPTNHLSEPPWVATIKMAGSLVAGLEHYDLQATHSN